MDSIQRMETTMTTTTSSTGRLGRIARMLPVAGLVVTMGLGQADALSAQARRGVRPDAPPRAERMERPRADAPRADRAGPGMRGERPGADARRGPGERGPGTRGPAMLVRMKDRLGLTDDQVSRLEALQRDVFETGDRVFDEQVALRRSVRDGDITVDDVRARRQELAEARRAAMTGMHDAIEAILTDEQRETIADLRDSARVRRDAPRGRRPAPRIGR